MIQATSKTVIHYPPAVGGVGIVIIIGTTRV